MIICKIKKRLCNEIVKNVELTSDQEDIIMYILEIIISDVSKFLILSLLFFLINQYEIFLNAMIVIIIFRSITGGIHFKTYYGCLFFSIVFFLLVLILSKTIIITNSLLFILTAFNLLVIVRLSPTQSSTRPIMNQNKRILLKLISCVIIIIYYILLLTNNVAFHANISLWVITLQCLQILIERRKQSYEKKAIIKKQVFNTFACILLAVSPLLVQNTSCTFFWGEPDCPDCFKKS